MLHLHNDVGLSELSKRKPQDIFPGDGVTQSFLFYNLNPDILSRVFLNDIFKLLNTDFYTYWVYPVGSSFIFFYTPPIVGTGLIGTGLIGTGLLGTSNIFCQSDSCLFFPGGTSDYGFLNACTGDTIDLPYYITNDDALLTYSNVSISSVCFADDEDLLSVKIAPSQAALDEVTAGEPLTIGDITDNGTAHEFWVRLTVPRDYIGPNMSLFNKNDLTFMLSADEIDTQTYNAKVNLSNNIHQSVPVTYNAKERLTINGSVNILPFLSFTGLPFSDAGGTL